MINSVARIGDWESIPYVSVANDNTEKVSVLCILWPQDSSQNCDNSVGLLLGLFKTILSSVRRRTTSTACLYLNIWRGHYGPGPIKNQRGRTEFLQLRICYSCTYITVSPWIEAPASISVTKGRFPLPEFTARVHGPSWRPENSIRWRPCTRPVYTGVRFPLPEFTARVDGCQKMHPSSRAVNSARELGPWTRVVETDLNWLTDYSQLFYAKCWLICCYSMLTNASAT